MKILFVTPSLPVNNGSGGAIRSYQIYQELKSFADVDVLTCNWRDIQDDEVDVFPDKAKYLGNVSIVPFMPIIRGWDKSPAKFKKVVGERKYDYIFVRYFISAYRLGLFSYDNLILDCDDCGLEISSQCMTSPLIPFHLRIGEYFMYKKMCYAYNKELKNIKHVFFSRKSNILKWESNFSTIPNKIPAIPANDDNYCYEESHTTILFVGVLSYFPNFLGLNYFLEKIWPDIIAARSNIKLKIVGSGLPKDFYKKWKNIKGIELCGYVEDIDSVYANVNFSISPIYHGSGTHIKIIESLIRSRTCVISQLSHRGYESTLLDGESMLVANTDREFVEKIIYLIDNPQLQRRMGEIGREETLRHHTICASDNLIKTKLLNSQA